MAKIIYEGDEIVNTTKRSKMNHATKIYMDKCKWGCCTIFNNLDDMLMWLLPLHIGQMELLSRRKGTSHLNCCLPKNRILWWLRCSKHLCHRSAKEENSISQIGNCGSSMMYRYMPVPNSQTPWITTWLSPTKTKHFSLSKTMTKPWSN